MNHFHVSWRSLANVVFGHNLAHYRGVSAGWRERKGVK